jgi:hypothetical protein
MQGSPTVPPVNLPSVVKGRPCGVLYLMDSLVFSFHPRPGLITTDSVKYLQPPVSRGFLAAHPMLMKRNSWCCMTWWQCHPEESRVYLDPHSRIESYNSHTTGGNHSVTGSVGLPNWRMHESSENAIGISTT